MQRLVCRIVRRYCWSDAGSAPEGIRTPNLLIRSQTLYPLSYGRWSTRPGHECTGRLRRLENERAVRFETDVGAEPAVDAAQSGS